MESEFGVRVAVSRSASLGPAGWLAGWPTMPCEEPCFPVNLLTVPDSEFGYVSSGSFCVPSSLIIIVRVTSSLFPYIPVHPVYPPVHQSSHPPIQFCLIIDFLCVLASSEKTRASRQCREAKLCSVLSLSPIRSGHLSEQGPETYSEQTRRHLPPLQFHQLAYAAPPGA